MSGPSPMASTFDAYLHRAARTWAPSGCPRRTPRAPHHSPLAALTSQKEPGRRYARSPSPDKNGEAAAAPAARGLAGTPSPGSSSSPDTTGGALGLHNGARWRRVPCAAGSAARAWRQPAGAHRRPLRACWWRRLLLLLLGRRLLLLGRRQGTVAPCGRPPTQRAWCASASQRSHTRAGQHTQTSACALRL
jgi:hypothetical protein